MAQAISLKTIFSYRQMLAEDFSGGAVVKNLPANAEDMGSLSGPGRPNLSPRATTTEARVPRARAPQQEKPPQWETQASAMKVSPHLATTREKPTHSNEDPVQPKIKNKTTLHMENFLVNVDFFYKTANFYLVFRASPKSAIS